MKQTIALLGAIALALGTASAAAAAPPPKERGAPANLHCPDHQTETKISESATVTVQDQGGQAVHLSADIAGSEVSFVGEDVESVSYCLKGGTSNTGIQSGLHGNTEHIPNRGGRTPDISYVVIYGVETDEPVDVTPCGQALSAGGGIEGFEGVYELGANSGTFDFYYEGQSVPDHFELIYEGEHLLDVATGQGVNSSAYAAWLADVEANASPVFSIDPVFSRTVQVNFDGDSSRITVRVTGSTAGTAWNLRLDCP